MCRAYVFIPVRMRCTTKQTYEKAIRSEPRQHGAGSRRDGFICIPQIVSGEIWKMLIGDNVLRGRYGVTCSQHNGIKDKLIITRC